MSDCPFSDCLIKAAQVAHSQGDTFPAQTFAFESELQSIILSLREQTTAFTALEIRAYFHSTARTDYSCLLQCHYIIPSTLNHAAQSHSSV